MYEPVLAPPRIQNFSGNRFTDLDSFSAGVELRRVVGTTEIARHPVDLEPALLIDLGHAMSSDMAPRVK